jgi:hypothetical protein
VHVCLYSFMFFLLVPCLVSQEKIPDCCCESETIISQNDNELHDLLQNLRNTTFFKIFKVNLQTECPFWEDNPACAMKGCSVLDLPKEQVPQCKFSATKTNQVYSLTCWVRHPRQIPVLWQVPEPSHPIDRHLSKGDKVWAEKSDAGDQWYE